jgi:apolipoprotein D and lipocalin family protein
MAHDVRDYMWVTARTPIAAPSDYDARLARMNALAYPMDKVRKVPRQ